MANPRDNVSDRNFELNRPSSSHSSTSHNVQHKVAKNNKIKDNKSSPLKKSPKTSPRQKHEDSKISNKTSNILNAITEIADQLNSVQLDDQKKNNSDQSMRKNAKKKERLKNLQMPPRDNVNPQSHIQSPASYDAAIQGYFINSINPMNSTNNSSYLQNLRYHPQYQFAYNLPGADNLRRRTVSVPSGPFMPMPNSNILRSPGAQSAPNTPGFVHNVMQHPLLSKTVSVTSKTETNKSPKQKQNKKTVTEDTKFEPYLSQEEIEEGLKNNTLLEGILRINPKHFQLAYVSSYDREEQDIFIDGMKHRNRALDGDVVIVQYVIAPEKEPDKKAENKSNKERNTQSKKESSNRSSKGKKKSSKKERNKQSDKVHNKNNIKDDNIQINKAKAEESIKKHNLESDTEDDVGNEVDGEVQNKREANLEIGKACDRESNIESIEESNTESNIESIKESNMESFEEINIERKEESNIERKEESNIESKEESNIETNKQKRGKVVYIKERVHKRTCIGNLKLMPDKNRQKALFVPRDNRFPRLNIPFSCWPDNFYQDHETYENTLFLARIEDWYDVRFAVGKIVCNIGHSGDMISESKAILAQNNLDVRPFGPEVRHLYPRLDYTIPKAEIDIREDCRSMCIFSIDPANCRDIDDAVSCRQLENGNYEVGVHISDVTHYLTENTLLDEIVAQKATTIYLVERAYHMLPDDLCMLCSLFPGVNKLAFSIFWEINDNAEVLNHRFTKSVINSCCQLTYDHAQAVLEDSKEADSGFPEIFNGFSFQHVQKTIKVLGKLSSILRKRRFDNGALRIDQPKISFKLNAQTGLPDSFLVYESKESHQLIEEFMLLANMSVAKRLHDHYPDIAFLRCHPPPSGHMLKYIAKILKALDIHIDISSAGDLHNSLLEHINSGDIGKAMVLNMLCAKPMSRAKYFCGHGSADSDFHHYALNVPLYTHFTSPIRRYADIMVHRLLAASINFGIPPNWEVSKVNMIAAQCNTQKYNAKIAGEMSIELYTKKYIELNSPVVTEAVVLETREKYIDVLVPSLGLNRRIFFNKDFPGEVTLIKNEKHNDSKLSKLEITWKAVDDSPEVHQTIQIFSILKIALTKGEGILKIETNLLKPE